MSKQCVMCDEKMGFFSRGDLCKNCAPHFSEWSSIKENITTLPTLNDQQLESLRKFGKVPLTKLYDQLYYNLESDKELDGNELATLKKVQDRFSLSNVDIKYVDRILPYIYVNKLRRTGVLPVVDPTNIVGTPILLKNNEVVHLSCPATLKEIRVVNLGYAGGSHGYSIRIAKGISYRVGSYRGHALKEERWVPISSGHLVITNQRIMLVPSAGGKQVNVALDKINFYRCYANGLQMYKEGREKGFFFDMEYGYIEIAGIILGQLVNSNN